MRHKFPIQFKSNLPRRTHAAQIRWHSHLCSLCDKPQPNSTDKKLLIWYHTWKTLLQATGLYHAGWLETKLMRKPGHAADERSAACDTLNPKLLWSHLVVSGLSLFSLSIYFEPIGPVFLPEYIPFPLSHFTNEKPIPNFFLFIGKNKDKNKLIHPPVETECVQAEFLCNHSSCWACSSILCQFLKELSTFIKLHGCDIL